MTIIEAGITVETLHRAACTLCTWKGELRGGDHPAQEDRIAHVGWHRDLAAAMTLAGEYLARHGVEVLDCNWVTSGGHLHMIADDHGTPVAVDLRVNKKSYGSPLEYMSNAKKRAMRGLLTQWMREHGRRADQIRVDVIGVLGDGPAGFTIEHVRAVA